MAQLLRLSNDALQYRGNRKVKISMKRRILPDFENETIPAYNFDVIIVGTGVAGLYAALNLDEDLEVAVVTKANIDESNSYLAQGGIAAVMTADDNYHNHVEDTLVAGAGLCNREAVEVLCEEGEVEVGRYHIVRNIEFCTFDI